MKEDLIGYKKTEEYEGLIGELVAGTIEFRKNSADLVVRYKYFVAKTIYEHPIYQKYGKGNQSFIVELIKDVNRRLSREEVRIGKSSMYDLLAVYEEYPDQEKAVVEIARKGLSPYVWNSYLSLVGRARDDSNKHRTICPKCGYMW